MRQSTLLFGRGAGSRAEVKDGGEGEENMGKCDGEAARPTKMPRRAAASKSEERSKRQMQMTLAHNGKLHRRSMEKEKERSPPIELESTDDDMVAPKKKKKTVAITKTAEPISLSVKGTLADSTQAHSFFAKRQLPTDTKGESEAPAHPIGLTAIAKQKWPQQREAPWPDSESIHVGAGECAFPSLPVEPLCHHPRRLMRSSPAEECDSLCPWSSRIAGPSSSPSSNVDISVRGCLGNLGAAFIEECVDLKSFLPGKMPAALVRAHSEANTGTRTSNNALWVDHWRPIRADQVLGNETRSLYLRDWLKELEVTAEVKAGKVIKRVEKRRKKSKREDLNGFIVDDEEEEQAWFDQFRKPVEGDVDANDEERDDDHGERRDYLMNAIVLQGPTGSGKTAAVYACAAELGFEVFEIYPGSGRRSGRDIGQAVGNLGRNHMVSSGGTGGGATWKGLKTVKTGGETGNPRQSLILLEEVDLLYEEDKGFWPAVVELISTSRRPVVMTCNDPACIPSGTFPIQDVLVFEPPNEAEAVAYLQLIALNQGHVVQRDDVLRLYQSTRGEHREKDTTSRWIVPASGPVNIGTTLASVDKVVGTDPSADLRQAIMQLQYLCQGDLPIQGTALVGDGADPSSDSKSHFKTAIEKAEWRSFCDAFLTRPFERASEIQEPDEYEVGINDVQVQGVTPLCKSRVRMEVTQLAMYGREEAYHHALLGRHDSAREADYDQRRWRESLRVTQLMDSLMLSEWFRMPSWISVVEFAPIVANMMQIDDDEQATYHARLSKTLNEIQDNFNANGRQSLDSASNSLLQMGIRPSRHTMRILLERNGDGSLALSRTEIAPPRWFELDRDVLKAVRETRLAM